MNSKVSPKYNSHNKDNGFISAPSLKNNDDNISYIGQSALFVEVIRAEYAVYLFSRLKYSDCFMQ